MEQYKIDSLDKKILNALLTNARIPFMEIARMCGVSGAAIHQRIQKMEEAGMIECYSIRIPARKLGYITCAFVGLQVNLLDESAHEGVFMRISKIDEITECHHVTGKYSLLLKIYAHDNEHLKKIITEKIQSIPEVTGTETIISLQEGFSRSIPIH